MKSLIDMYKIYSPSGSEAQMSTYVEKKIAALGIAYFRDKHGQLYSFANPGRPVVCAHMDQVSNRPLKHLVAGKKYIHGDANLGADDKNGVWMCLELLKTQPDLNFIFSVQEESGGKIHELLDAKIEALPYCLVFDRMGSGDIIGTSNGYCHDDFETDIAAIGLNYGYAPAQGVYSDCDALCAIINCVNLSCGYRNAHTKNEYTVIKELQNALQFAIAITQSDMGISVYPLPDGNAWDDYGADAAYSWISIEGRCPLCYSKGQILESAYEDEFLCLACGQAFTKEELTIYGGA